MKKVTVVHVDYADMDEDTEVVNVVTLSDGKVLRLWAGKPTYTKFDESRGRLVVGAELVKIEKEDGFTVYHFFKALRTPPAGFSLIELLVVMTIFAALIWALVAVVSFTFF